MTEYIKCCACETTVEVSDRLFAEDSTARVYCAKCLDAIGGGIEQEEEDEN